MNPKHITDPDELACMIHLLEGALCQTAAKSAGIKVMRAIALSENMNDNPDNLDMIFGMDQAGRDNLRTAVLGGGALVSLDPRDSSAIAVIEDTDDLDTATRAAALALTNRITVLSHGATTSDTLAQLAMSLATIQNTFFGATNTQGGSSGFEAFLKD